ncbi:MAG: hypothetical protein H3Z49_01330, partial [archaeon]|nr:hypothetical protein [archaeon]
MFLTSMFRGFLLIDRKVLTWCLVVSLHASGIFLIVPLLSPFLYSVGASPFLIGFMMAFGLGLRTLICLPLGVISDKLGRKK